MKEAVREVGVMLRIDEAQKMEELRTLLDGQLRSRVCASLRCVICLQVTVSPIIFATCCQQIIGCDVCIIQWLTNNDTYPHCRTSSAHGFNYYSLKSFDDLSKSLH